MSEHMNSDSSHRDDEHVIRPGDDGVTQVFPPRREVHRHFTSDQARSLYEEQAELAQTQATRPVDMDYEDSSYEEDGGDYRADSAPVFRPVHEEETAFLDAHAVSAQGQHRAYDAGNHYSYGDDSYRGHAGEHAYGREDNDTYEHEIADEDKASSRKLIASIIIVLVLLAIVMGGFAWAAFTGAIAGHENTPTTPPAEQHKSVTTTPRKEPSDQQIEKQKNEQPTVSEEPSESQEQQQPSQEPQPTVTETVTQEVPVQPSQPPSQPQPSDSAPSQPAQPQE